MIPPPHRPVESFSMGGGTGSREGKLSLGSWVPASDQYHPSTKHQQTPLWGLTHPGAVAWPRNQVCSAVLPRERASDRGGAQRAQGYSPAAVASD